MGTNYSTIISYKGERTILEMKYPARLRFERFPKTKWVYLSSIKQDPKLVYEPLVRLKKEMGFNIAFNPGMFQLSHKGRDIVNFLRFVDVLIVNKEEANILVARIADLRRSKRGSTRKHNSPQPSLTLRDGEFSQIPPLKIRGGVGGVMNLCSMLCSATEGIVFITDGERGAWGFDGAEIVHCQKFPAKSAIDRTGAGDAFSSGVIAGLVRRVRFPEVIRWGMANSAAALRKVGPQNGILDNREMGEVLRKIKIRPRSL